MDRRLRLLFVGIDCLGVGRFGSFVKEKLNEVAPAMVWGECYAPVPNTGPSWTSILTGLRFEEHGVTHMLGLPRNGSKSFRDLQGRYVFERLPGPVGVFNLPTTYPPRGRPGDWMVSGYPADPHTFPSGLLDGIDYVGDYARMIVKMRTLDGKRPFWPDEYSFETAAALMKMIERLHLVALTRLPMPEYLFVCTTLFDRVAHQVHDRGPDGQTGPLDDAAQFIADWLLRLLDRFPADTVVLVSDHGWDQQKNGHSPHGFWAMWGAGVTESGRIDIHNHELRARIEAALAATDPDVEERLRALGYE